MSSRPLPLFLCSYICLCSLCHLLCVPNIPSARGPLTISMSLQHKPRPPCRSPTPVFCAAATAVLLTQAVRYRLERRLGKCAPFSGLELMADQHSLLVGVLAMGVLGLLLGLAWLYAVRGCGGDCWGLQATYSWDTPLVCGDD